MNDLPVLEGEKVRLQPLTAEDVPLLTRWFRDAEVVHHLQLSEDPPELMTIEAVRERFNYMDSDPFTRVWRIDTKAGRPIGQIELVNLHPLQKRAEMHISIGEKDYWSGGYGSDAVLTMLRFAFNDLGLRRVYATPDADNIRAIRSFEKCGFVLEGTLREHRLRHGQPVDMVMMGALRKEQQ
ncbi:MAG: N-acetyltransferase [Chloroflexi bacterium]|nr:MAG: N-acetyltransferase [Chloroflexota bacterium]